MLKACINPTRTRLWGYFSTALGLIIIYHPGSGKPQCHHPHWVQQESSAQKQVVLSLSEVGEWRLTDLLGLCVRGPLHPNYRGDGGLHHQQTLGSSGENKLTVSGVSGHSASVHTQPTLVSSLLIRGQGLHGQWISPKRAALIQLAIILFAFVRARAFASLFW